MTEASPLRQFINRLSETTAGKVAAGGIAALAVGGVGFMILTSAECGSPGYGNQVPPSDIISGAQAAIKGLETNTKIPANVKADMIKKYQADIARAQGAGAGGVTKGGPPPAAGQ